MAVHTQTSYCDVRIYTYMFIVLVPLPLLSSSQSGHYSNEVNGDERTEKLTACKKLHVYLRPFALKVVGQARKYSISHPFPYEAVVKLVAFRIHY